MFKIIFSLFLYSTLLYEKDTEIKKYLDFLQEYPRFMSSGDRLKNEIQIIIDEDEIRNLQKNEFEKLLAKGVDPKLAAEWSRPGIAASDTYLLWVRDPVIFPKGHKGLYKRIIWKCTLNGEHPIAVLPVTKNGEVILIRTWRHATGSWEFEIPRGAPNAREEPSVTALRELKEETGFVAKQIQALGTLNPDSGVLSTTIEVFLAIGDIETTQDTDDDEIISAPYAFSIKELEQHLINGYIEIQGSRANLRDPFLTYALYQAKLKKLL